MQQFIILVADIVFVWFLIDTEQKKKSQNLTSLTKNKRMTKMEVGLIDYSKYLNQ